MAEGERPKRIYFVGIFFSTIRCGGSTTREVLTRVRFRNEKLTKARANESLMKDIGYLRSLKFNEGQ